MVSSTRQRILLIGIGQENNIGRFFREALEAGGCEHAFVDEWRHLSPEGRSLAQRALNKVFRRPRGYDRFNAELLATFDEFRPDIVLVTKGPFVSVEALRQMKSGSRCVLVNYATDDPYNPANQTPDLINGIPYYDLYVCPRRAMIRDIEETGCARTAYLPFGYHPRLHFAEPAVTSEERRRFECDVVFIGNADRDRAPFFRKLLDIPDLSLHLHGAGWKSDALLARFDQGFIYDRDFRLALSCAKVAVCLVRRANRDDNVMRTFETPACGAFMLAERTAGHLALFREGIDIGCFGSPTEFAARVAYYLANPRERAEIARSGTERTVSGNNTYADRLAEILRLANAL